MSKERNGSLSNWVANRDGSREDGCPLRNQQNLLHHASLREHDAILFETFIFTCFYRFIRVKVKLQPL